MPKAISGHLRPLNGAAIEWGWHGFLAYSSCSLVVVLHVDSMNLVQTLMGHSNTVVKVRWCHEIASKDNPLNDSYGWYLRLASADSEGRIILWDVVRGFCKQSFRETSKVVDMQWLIWQGASSDLLLVLYQPAVLILWNADQGTQLWKMNRDDGCLVAMALDPFNFQRIAFLNNVGNLIMLNDLSLSTTPSAFGKPYRVAPSYSSQEQSPSDDASSKRSVSSFSIKQQLAKALNAASPSSSSSKFVHGDIFDGTGEFTNKQLTFHPAKRGHLFLVFSRDILLVNVTRMQIVLNLTLDTHVSPVLSLLPCSSRDAFYLVQENGQVSLRLRKYNSKQADPRTVQVSYDVVCSTDYQAKDYKLIGACLNPQTEFALSLVSNNGRVLRYNLGPAFGYSRMEGKLDDCVMLNVDTSQSVSGELKFFMVGTTSGVGSSASLIRVCPAWEGTKHQTVAIGHLDGLVQLADLRTGEVRRDFMVHSCAVRCLEWCGRNYTISSGYQQTLGSPSVVRNELIMLDVKRGTVKQLRPEKDESPIELLRVSYFRSYLAVAFRRQPLEIWDLKSFRLLRKMSRRCPVVVDMAWSSKHHQVQKIVKDTDSAEALSSHRDIYRENMVVLDIDNHLWHVVVKGMHVRDGQEVQTQWSTSGSVTSMAWKQDLLIFGDNDGRVSCWDIDAKIYKSGTPLLGSVRRLRFCTFPGDFTAIALHLEGVSRWNAKEMSCLSQIKFSQLNMRLIDIDITEDGVPVILNSDGCVRLLEADLTSVNENVEENLLSTVFCPLLCSKSGAFCTRQLLVRLPEIAKELNDSDANMCDRLLDHLVAKVQMFNLEEKEKVQILKQLHCVDKERLIEMSRNENVIQMSIVISSLFGDEWAVKFWTLLRYTLDVDEEETSIRLPLSFDYFLPRETFRKSEKLTCATFDSKNSSADQVEHQVTTLILLGEYDAAVQVLIEADSSRPDYFADCLKACLLSADRSLPECQSTIKLVATSLIAGGKLTDGIQLLRIIDKSIDACRYLQSFGLWEESVWLAKVALDQDSCNSAFLKWIEHLCSSEMCHKAYALLLLVSLGQWSKLVDLLLSMGLISVAASFVDALEAKGRSSLVETIPKSLADAVRLENASLLKLCRFIPL